VVKKLRKLRILAGFGGKAIVGCEIVSSGMRRKKPAQGAGFGVVLK
jgi:hypothetical protein